MEEYMHDVLLHLVEKTKTNQNLLGEDHRVFFFSSEQQRYLKATEDYDDEDFSLYITDGRKEFEILQKMEQWFPQEINAGTLSTKDIAKFYIQDNFNKALKVLDDALTQTRQFELDKQQQAIDSSNAQANQNYKLATEDREDKQQHELDKETLKGQQKKEEILLKGQVDSGLLKQDGMQQASLDRMGQQSTPITKK